MQTATGKGEIKQNPFLKEMRKNFSIYLMIIPAACVTFLLAYLPLPGIIIAFKEYNFADGIWASPFNGIANFKFFFTSPYAWSTTKHTLWINFNYLLWGTTLSVLFAIMLNELRGPKSKKIYQNVMFLPYFFSSVVIAMLVKSVIFSDGYGIVNQILVALGFEKFAFSQSPEPWVPIIVSAHTWQFLGYNTIIYLAAISGIDEQLFEAASLDGAGRLSQIRHIIFPLLVPTITTLCLLAIGRMMYGDFATIYSIIDEGAAGSGSIGINGIILKNTDIIETYIYRAVRKSADFQSSSAVGLYQSIIGFILVFGSNWIVKRFGNDNSLF